MSDTKIIQTTRKSSYFAFITAYKGKVTGFSSSLDDFSVRHNPLVFHISTTRGFAADFSEKKGEVTNTESFIEYEKVSKVFSFQPFTLE